VWLVRHGQTDWNLSRRYMSRSDRPLTPYGIRQAQTLADYCARRKIDVVVHSGLSPTADTAAAIARPHGLTPLADPNWREADHGEWEGLTYADVTLRMPDEAKQRFTDPVNLPPRGGESLGAMGQRALRAYQSLGARFPGQRVLVVAHAGPIQALLCGLMETPLGEHWRWRIDAGSISGFDVYPTTTILRTVNHVPRLTILES
jgi:2,3-bisphosphoglycerate-dependent phosphoglycerate mutase/probable phosphoglycerate mutase